MDELLPGHKAAAPRDLSDRAGFGTNFLGPAMPRSLPCPESRR